MGGYAGSQRRLSDSEGEFCGPPLPRDHLTSSGAGLTVGEYSWSHPTREGRIGVMPSRPPRRGVRPGTSTHSAGPAGRPVEERDRLLVSGLRSSTQIKMGRNREATEEKRRKRVELRKKELNPQTFSEPVGFPETICKFPKLKSFTYHLGVLARSSYYL